MKDKWEIGVDYAELTDIGMRRANNQDSHVCVPAKSPDRFTSHGHLFVVADGMGAHAAGELASQMATEKIAMHYFRSENPDSHEALRTAVIEANTEIHQRGQNNPEFHNMGTTASSMAILPAGAVIAHVGDSRVYRLRDGILEQLTFDHSLIWEVEASGRGDSGYWGQAIPKNVITRSLGPNAAVEVDVEGPFPIQKDDRFLLCSDGLTGLVEDEEIGTLMDCLSEDQAARVMVDLANLRGGPDNITVVIVKANDAVGKTKATNPHREPSWREGVSPFLWGGTLFCLLIAALFGGMALAGQTQSVGGMVVMLVLAAIAGGISIRQYLRFKEAFAARPVAAGGKAPYRRYDAKPTNELYNRLGDTVRKLKEAAEERNWMMEWEKVDKFQAQGVEALRSKDIKQAIRFQAEAIIETMKQLREQHNRAANETAIDH